MFSTKFAKEKNYIKIKNHLQKNQKEQSPNSIIINYTCNNPINFTKIKTINNYQTLNSAKNSNKFSSKIPLQNNRNSIKEKLSIETYNNKNQNFENNYYHLNNFSPMISLNKSLNAKTLSDKIDYFSFYYNDDNSFLKQKILNKLNQQKKQKLILQKYKFINNNNSTLRTVKNCCLRKPLFNNYKKGTNNIINNNNMSRTNEIKNIKNRSFTEKINKYYNFSELNKKRELYRNFEDLEKKSLEISKRKMIKKNNSNKNFFRIKKDNNLIDIKQSLDNIRKQLHNKEEKNKIIPESISRNNNISININKTLNSQNSIKAVYHISKIKKKINKTNKNNSDIKKIKRIFIIKSDIKKRKNINDKKSNQSPYVKKNYIEDQNYNTLNNNKYKIITKKILPAISEENDKIKINLNNLMIILKKLIAKKEKNSIEEFFLRLKNNKRSKNVNIIYNTVKKPSNFKYSKKIIPKNKNNKLSIDNKRSHMIKLLSEEKQNKNKFSIFKNFGKIKKMINNLRLNLIEFSLKNHSYS